MQLIDAEPILLNNNNQSKHHLRFAKHVEKARTRAQVLPGGGPSMLSTWEKFHSATIELAGSGPIKQRLLGAYVHHLASLTEEQVPKEIREDFCTFSREMRAVRPLPGEDPVRATVRKMSADDANRHAVQIVNMLGVVSRSQMTSRASDLAPVVQLYADLSAASRS